MIVPYKPKAIVWHVGGNNLWKKQTPAATAKLFCTTVKKLLVDGPHPNAKGYRIWNDVVAAKVKAHMKALGIESGSEKFGRGKFHWKYRK